MIAAPEVNIEVLEIAIPGYLEGDDKGHHLAQRQRRGFDPMFDTRFEQLTLPGRLEYPAEVIHVRVQPVPVQHRWLPLSAHNLTVPLYP